MPACSNPSADSVKGVKISRGLQGQDDNLDALSALFEQLQLLTVDASNPELDLITFAHSAYFFGVITEVDELTQRKCAAPESDQESTWSMDEEPTRTPKRCSSPIKVESNDEVVPHSSSLIIVPQKGSSAALEPPAIKPLNAHDNGTSDELSLDAYLDNHYSEFEAQQPSSSNAISSMWDDYKIPSNPPKFDPASQVSLYDDDNDIYSETKNEWHWTPPALPGKEPLVGIVYLTSSQNYGDLLHVGELNIGIILEPAFRKKGYARKAIEKVLETAFADQTCHRIQAIILDSWAKDRALNLFMQSRFGHEGTRRRAFFGPFDSEWKDTTYLAMLDTDWVMRTCISPRFRVAPKSLWDELFARHQREREELLRWEERNNILKRSISMETVRNIVALSSASTSASEDEAMTDSESVNSATASSKRVNGKKRRIDVGDSYDASASESEGEPELVAGLRSPPPLYDPTEWVAQVRSHRSTSPASSQSGESVHSDGSYTTSSSSPWDHMESASDGSLSDFGYQILNLDSDGEDDDEL
ncbi:uncharacterized protein LACBIDRAFT_318670 [Laccaria bicolor S238N-H82]|uniref:Predicted protein n=1 Tax=Laccaria bicolor (strain S238N-H82 / ATCC MYA-4686) TaxID=486041 RepID=B0D6R7_LACBS|nr:uncharacterized protein LACBIDRAFT_318670 [Laccaria bicolor S238N-H82]EDR09523.1 predicted protein [Laccaria bicolor S238N-H82]|eukprot:XP_001879872.1 predicted protein [Laccaria bicolor S238N-H82]